MDVSPEDPEASPATSETSSRAEELHKVLEAHSNWLSSSETRGTRADLSRANLNGIDLSGVDLSGAVLRGAILDNARLHGAKLTHADLVDASLRGADLSGADLLLADFTGADLSGADLSDTASTSDKELGNVNRGPTFRNAVLDNANLQRSYCASSDFSGSHLAGTQFTDTNLAGANLSQNDFCGALMRRADLTGADLRDSAMRKADLRECVLARANLSRADLSEADISGANLQSANLGDTKVDGIRYDRSGKFRGIRVATCYGSSRFKRFAQDQDYIEEFHDAYPVTYWAWWVLTDCGRSMVRVVMWSMGVIVLFAFAYLALGEQAFTVGSDTIRNWNFVFTAIYASVANFVTLGFGDVLPLTRMAAVVVMAEVITGYVTLGILISILATKVGRRS